MVFSTSKFESISIRPPTPPKDLKDDDQDADIALEFLDDPFGTKSPSAKVAAKQSLLNTPEQSPSSEIGSVSSISSSRKRVSFGLKTCTIQHKGLSPAQWTPRNSSPLRPLPQTRVSKPLKSILKACDPASTPPQPSEGAAPQKLQTFAEMLESIVKLLASGARASRLDAYISLTKTMQAYEQVPDADSLVLKMGLLSQFIQRDMQAVSIMGTGPDSQLISQALRLLMALVRIPELRPVMDDAFCSFVIDRIIQVTADPGMPKTIINTHLAVLMQQNFRPKTMTIARVEKIVDILDNITERVSGNSVHAYRLRVYRKLVQQRPDTMTKHTERWFKHTLSAMLSPQKDINQSALDMAISATKTIGSDRHVVKSVLAVLNREKSDGNTVAKVLVQQLEKLLAGDSAPLVPQIWAAVTALLKDSLQGTAFTALADWLKLFEKFFASQHELVKVHANVAFGFLVYALNISTATPPHWSRILINIPQQQLQRRAQCKAAELNAATSSYFTLLYSTLRPTASHEQLDRYWGEFVADFWRPLIRLSPARHAIAACRIVSALLRGSRKPWDEQRALDLRPQSMIDREELPLLDPKWTRRSLSTILHFVETLLESFPWTPEVEDEPFKTMWISLLDSLVEASSKEVMASTETKDAIAHIVNLLRRMWDRHTTKLAISQQKEDNWANKFCFLVETVVQKLGAFQFADKCLTRNGDDEFEVAPTPSHRSRQHGPRISPLLYFVELLVSRSEGKLSDPVRLRIVVLVLEPCLKVQNTRLGRLELLKDCSTAVDPASRTVVAFDFWSRIATLTKSCIQEQSSDSNERVSRQLGKEYELVVDILALGSSYFLETPRGREVLSSFVETVRKEAGEGAVVLAVVEQVSKSVLKRVVGEGQDSRVCLPYTSTLLRSLPTILTRRTLDQGKQNLSPSSPTPARNPEFDPYKNFYVALISVGLSTYRDLDINDVESTRDFLDALGDSIRHCPISLLAVYLRKTQDFVSLWIEDPDAKLQKNGQRIKDLHREVVKLWQIVSGAIDRLPRKDGQMLSALETLLAAGFLSRRRSIVNISVTTWNSTFGKESSLRFPSRLEKALQRIRNTVDLSVPSLAAGVDSRDDFSFYESDTSVQASVKKVRTPRVKESPFRITKATRKSPRKSGSPAVSSTSGRRVSSRLTPKVRLRHDNSQVHFEPILSSPTNPFNQEYQILTERQKEMIERQKITGNLFSDLRTTPRPEANGSIPSPQLHYDTIDNDDLPTSTTRTPMKTLPSLGPMDAFIGSSPTPQARNRSQKVERDEMSVSTPNAVRTVRLANEMEDLGSSPPQFEKSLVSNATDLTDNNTTDEIPADSFEYRQPTGSSSLSVDDGTTIEVNLLHAPEVLEAEANDMEGPADEFAIDADVNDWPNSTIDLQLTAQLDAELNARIESTANEQPREMETDSTSEVPTGTDADVEETQFASKDNMPRSSSTSRVGDSFSSQSAAKDESHVHSLRRSSRNAGSSPQIRNNSRKRRQSLADTPTKIKTSKKGASSLPPSSDPVQNIEEHPANLEVASPQVPDTAQHKRGSKRKSRGGAHSPANSPFVVPETCRKRSIPRSASLLSQVETHFEDILVEGTPAPKRPRRGTSKDVSEGRTTPESSGSHVKRLSHVQVTPKSSSSLSSVPSSARRASAVVDDAEGTTLDRKISQHNVVIHEAHIQDEVMHDEALQNPSILALKQEHLNAEHELQPETTTPVESVRSQSQDAPIGVATPSRAPAERNILTPRSLIDKLKGVKDMIVSYGREMILGRQEERELDDLLFDIRTEMHAAGRREQVRG